MGYLPPRLRSHGRYVSWSVARRLTLIASKLDPRKDPTMAKNFMQPGRIVTLVAPTAVLSAGKQCKLAPCSGSRPSTRSGGRVSKLRSKGSGSFRRRPSPSRGGRRSFGTREPEMLPPTSGPVTPSSAAQPRRGAPLTQRSESDLTACSVRGCPRRSAIHFRDLTFGRIILRKHAGSRGRPEG